MTANTHGSDPASPSAIAGLRRVRAPGGGGLYASAGDLFKDAFFARDAIEAAEHLIDIDPTIAREVIREVARLQGTRDVPSGALSTEEQIGRIHHESRQLIINGTRISPESERILDTLSKRWGGTPERMTYYGTVDATPQYVRLVRECVRRHGPGLLDETLENKDGDIITVRSSVEAAARWVERQINASSTGLLEFLRRNPDGIEYQVWKDGKISLMHPDGTLADYRQPIATVEVQGLAYDALLGASELFAGTAEGQRWVAAADKLRETTFRRLWMPAEGYFACGIDRDQWGRPRQIKTITSAGAELLDTRIFEGLSRERYKTFVGGLVRTVMGHEFLTPAGIRCTALRHARMVDHWPYQGVFTAWFKDTFDVARGLRRQGFGRLAEQLEVRIINTVNIAGNPLEFVYVDRRNQVVYDPANRRGLEHPRVIVATNIPDRTQTWTVSAFLACKWLRGRGAALPQPAQQWARMLEIDLLGKMPFLSPVRSSAVCARIWRRSPGFTVDRELGKERERGVVERNAHRLGELAAPQGLALGA